MDQQMLRGFRADSRTMVRELGFLQDSWAPAGVPHAHVHLLVELGERGVLRPSDLAEALRSDPAVVSRNLRDLTERGLVTVDEDPSDRRQRLFSLTGQGRQVLDGIHEAADTQVRASLTLLTPGELEAALVGMHAYAKALRRARLQLSLTLRPLEPADDPQVTALIRTVMPEFGASGPGFAIHDPEVEAMSAAYAGPRAGYWVVERDGRVLGGGGFAPLRGGDGATCELRKMYFLPELRGLGVGARLLRTILDAATAAGFRSCYLETLEHMTRARRLYEAFGFQQLDAPRGATGHFGCDAWYELQLTATSASSSSR